MEDIIQFVHYLFLKFWNVLLGQWKEKNIMMFPGSAGQLFGVHEVWINHLATVTLFIPLYNSFLSFYIVINLDFSLHSLSRITHQSLQNRSIKCKVIYLSGRSQKVLFAYRYVPHTRPWDVS